MTTTTVAATTVDGIAYSQLHADLLWYTRVGTLAFAESQWRDGYGQPRPAAEQAAATDLLNAELIALNEHGEANLTWDGVEANRELNPALVARSAELAVTTILIQAHRDRGIEDAAAPGPSHYDMDVLFEVLRTIACDADCDHARPSGHDCDNKAAAALMLLGVLPH